MGVLSKHIGYYYGSEDTDPVCPFYESFFTTLLVGIGSFKYMIRIGWIGSFSCIKQGMSAELVALIEDGNVVFDDPQIDFM